MVGPWKVGPKGWVPEGVGARRGGGPRVGSPTFRAFFSVSHRKFHSSLSLGRGAQMCTFGLSGCRVKPRATTVEKATDLIPIRVDTRAECECIAHALSIQKPQSLQLTALARDVAGGSEVPPFVRMFYGTPSEYLWEDDDDGEVHKTTQGEGGEQGDHMMPLLHSLDQHRALEAIDREMGTNQHLMAFLDDIFFVTMPRTVGEVYAVVQENLWIHSCIRVHVGKTKVWSRENIRPMACDMLEIARVQHPLATMWRGSFPLQSKASRCWEPLWGTRIS